MAHRKDFAKIDMLGHQTHIAWTPTRRKRFLERLAETGNVRLAAELAGVSRAHANKLRRAEPDFAKGWEDALQDFADRLEEAARRRAIEGYPRPIVSSGKLVGYATVFSDRLLVRMLEAHRPQKYRRQPSAEVSAPHAYAPPAPSPRERIERRIARVLSGGSAEDDPEGCDQGGTRDPRS